MNASTGKFRASNSTDAINTANLLLAGLAGPLTGNFRLTFLESVGHRSQNLVTGNPIPVEIPSVPVPAAGLLLFSALAGTGLLARMKRRSAR